MAHTEFFFRGGLTLYFPPPPCERHWCRQLFAIISARSRCNGFERNSNASPNDGHRTRVYRFSTRASVECYSRNWIWIRLGTQIDSSITAIGLNKNKRATDGGDAFSALSSARTLMRQPREIKENNVITWCYYVGGFDVD